MGGGRLVAMNGRQGALNDDKGGDDRDASLIVVSWKVDGGTSEKCILDVCTIIIILSVPVPDIFCRRRHTERWALDVKKREGEKRRVGWDGFSK